MATRRTSRPTLPLIRSGRVTAWQSIVSLAQGAPRSGEMGSSGSRSVAFEVELLEPIKGRTAVQINVTERSAGDSPRTAVDARITTISKSVVHVIATASGEEMSGLMALATSNQLRSCLLACEDPYRGRAAIVALRVGTQEPDDLG